MPRSVTGIFARQKKRLDSREVRPFYPKGFICLWVFCLSVRYDQRRTPDRAKSSASQTIKMIAEEVYEVRAEGRRIQLTTVELLLHIVSAKATSGDLSASRWLDELENRFTSASETGGFLVAPEVLSPAEWIEEQERLNLTRTDPRLKDHGLNFH
jgi:hypothetical protein